MARACRKLGGGLRGRVRVVTWLRRRRDGRGRSLRGARRDRDLCKLTKDMPATLKLSRELACKHIAVAQSLAQILVAIAHRQLQPGDRALGDFGRGDQFRDGGLERLLVSPAVSSNAC